MSRFVLDVLVRIGLVFPRRKGLLAQRVAEMINPGAETIMQPTRLVRYPT
jgi:hypothetical protein